ncbi:MAG: glycosyltransferase family 2 protein [Pseudoxanthomonas sp.]
MAPAPDISAIIPTYNRRELLLRALDSVFSQTHPIDEIVVIDDGSTDGSEAAVRERHGDRIRYIWQANAGVSAARNHGMSIAKGKYFALLDSDDEWLPEKTSLQLEWLRAHPDFGMVLCDVQRVDGEHRPIDIFRRRDTIPEDGWVLRWIIHNPALAPASIMFRREVFEDVGGFDEGLRTAEDIDFHLRVAHRWKIGVVEKSLVRAMRGHDGLSAEASTYDDYVRVVEGAVKSAKGLVDPENLKIALATTYARNAKGLLIQRRWRDGALLALRAHRTSQDPELHRELRKLIPLGLRRMLRGLLPKLK